MRIPSVFPPEHSIHQSFLSGLSPALLESLKTYLHILLTRVLEGYVASRLTMSNKVYMLQVSDGEDPKLLSKIITTNH